MDSENRFFVFFEKILSFFQRAYCENNTQFYSINIFLRRKHKKVYYITNMKTPKEQRSIFSQRLIELRKAKGMTQHDLAKALELPRDRVGYFEAKATNPTADSLQKLARFFNVPVDYLLGTEDLPTGKKPGPDSDLEKRFKELQKLPRSQQKTALTVLDGLLSQFKKTS